MCIFLAFSRCCPSRGVVLIYSERAKRQPAVGEPGEEEGSWQISNPINSPWMRGILFLILTEMSAFLPPFSICFYMWHLDVQTFYMMQKYKKSRNKREGEGEKSPVCVKTVITCSCFLSRPVEEPWSAVVFLTNLILPFFFFLVQALSFVSKLSFLLVSLADLWGSPSGGVCSLLSGWAWQADGPFIAMCSAGVLALACSL